MTHSMEDKNKSFFDRFNLFDKIVKLITKHGKVTVMYGVVILLLVYNILLNPIDLNKILERYDAKLEEAHKEGIQKRQRADEEIPTILEALRLKCGADRVMLLEFHNGSKNSADLEFYHFTATYEIINEDNDSIDFVNDQYRNQNTGNYYTLFNKLRKDRYLYSSDLDEDNSKFVKKMQKNDVQTFYLCAVYDDSNDLIGVLSISSNQNNGLDEGKLNRITPVITHKIANLITGING